VSAQATLDLIGGNAYGVVDLPRGLGELGAGDALPAGTYTIGLTHEENGYSGPPWTVCCGDGRAIAGHVPSREIAQAIADALNREFPA
jgi:hypothetical protein